MTYSVHFNWKFGHESTETFQTLDGIYGHLETEVADITVEEGNPHFPLDGDLTLDDLICDHGGDFRAWLLNKLNAEGEATFHLPDGTGLNRTRVHVEVGAQAEDRAHARYPLDADGRTMLALLGDDPNTLQHEPAREAARVLAYYWSSMDAAGVTPDKLRGDVADISQRLARWVEKVIVAQKG